MQTGNRPTDWTEHEKHILIITRATQFRQLKGFYLLSETRQLIIILSPYPTRTLRVHFLFILFFSGLRSGSSSKVISTEFDFQ